MAEDHSPPSVHVSGTRARRGQRPYALTGTPGPGKSSVGQRLAGRWRIREVIDLARQRGCAHERPMGWEVDLRRLARSLRRKPPEDLDIVVGHLAHLLPVRGAVVLRCHPLELKRRLGRAHRGTASERRANVLAEVLDIVATEARDRGLPFMEIDTTGLGIDSVSRRVVRSLRRLRRNPPPAVDWLSDPRVTEHLLDLQP